MRCGSCEYCGDLGLLGAHEDDCPWVRVSGSFREGERVGAERERRVVVEWLRGIRDDAVPFSSVLAERYGWLADDVEAGVHLGADVGLSDNGSHV